jgi:phosphomannomutase / phosphoglucomutase
MAYFGQFALDCPCVAMVTASHNDNGWTGREDGREPPDDLRPRRDGPAADIVLERRGRAARGRRLRIRRRASPSAISPISSMDSLDHPQAQGRRRLRQRHGGPFAPRVLEAIGCEVIPLDCELDHTFPRYNPNPEDMAMLHALADKVRETGRMSGSASTATATAAASSTNEGEEIFADKIGVMLARDLSKLHPNANSSST